MNYYYKPYVEDTVEEYYKNSIKEYFEERLNFKNNNLKYLTLIERKELALPEKECVQFFKAVVKDIMSYGVKPSDIVYAFDNSYAKKTFSKQELNNLKKLESYAKMLGVKTGVYDYYDVYDYEKVLKADKKIKELAYEVSKHNYSPLEKLLHTYLLLSKMEYKSEDLKNESPSLSRSVYGVFNSDRIVCAGFSEALKAVIQEENDKNLKVFANDVATKTVENKKTEIEYHQNNTAFLTDEKYKIKEKFFNLDVTWDSAAENSLIYFMLNILNIKDINSDNIIDFNDALKLDDNNLEETVNSKSKENNYSYTDDIHYSSVSKEKTSISNKEKDAIDEKYRDNLLGDFLLNYPKFKDFLILNDTLLDMKRNRKSFDELLQKNADKLEKDITKSKTLKKPKEVFRFLAENSEHIDIGQIQDALQVVIKETNPDKSKDEISKTVYNILKQNIIDAKEDFVGETTAWTECENLK